jgi:hypothetical protein
MQQFSAEAYFHIAQYLANLRAVLRLQGPDSELGPSLDEGSGGYKTVQAVADACKLIGLTTSIKCVDHLIKVGHEGGNISHMIEAVSQLERTVEWEMGDKLFMFIPPDRAEWYNKPESFGKDVNAKFPTVQFDIVEAGNCYASGRSTATVFHSMRIMEVGVQELGRALSVPLVNQKVWQVILDGINKAIKGLDPKLHQTIEMSQAAANLYAVKLATRNEVMHPKQTYTMEEADNILRQVRIFMQHLATLV